MPRTRRPDDDGAQSARYGVGSRFAGRSGAIGWSPCAVHPKRERSAVKPNRRASRASVAGARARESAGQRAATSMTVISATSQKELFTGDRKCRGRRPTAPTAVELVLQVELVQDGAVVRAEAVT